MSERIRELAARQQALQLRCVAERHAVAREVRRIEQRLAPVDRLVATARATVLSPVAIVVVVVAVVSIGRMRGLRLLGRALLLAAAVRRLLSALRML